MEVAKIHGESCVSYFGVARKILLYNRSHANDAFGINKWSFPKLQCEAPKIAKLVYNSNNYGLW